MIYEKSDSLFFNQKGKRNIKEYKVKNNNCVCREMCNLERCLNIFMVIVHVEKKT